MMQDMSAIIFRSAFSRVLPLAAASMMAACASTPTTLGDYAVGQGKKWNRGTEMVEEGQDLIKKGNGQIKDGNENVSEGSKLVSDGNALIAEAEAALKAQRIKPVKQ